MNEPYLLTEHDLNSVDLMVSNKLAGKPTLKITGDPGKWIGSQEAQIDLYITNAWWQREYKNICNMGK